MFSPPMLKDTDLDTPITFFLADINQPLRRQQQRMMKRLRGHDPSILTRIEQLLERDKARRFFPFVFGLLLTLVVFGLEEPAGAVRYHA